MVVSGGCFPTKRDTGSRSGHEETQATTQGGSGSEASRLPEEEEPASDEESQERSDTDWADFLSTHEVLTSAAFLGIERRMAGEITEPPRTSCGYRNGDRRGLIIPPTKQGWVSPPVWLVRVTDALSLGIASALVGEVVTGDRFLENAWTKAGEIRL